MVQLRCSNCGFLQILSEERFLATPEDFVVCPHCQSQVPKRGNPARDETVPEEASQKIVAFSRRILSGRYATRDVVLALESLVRHYRPAEEANKALGLGFTSLGEYEKAEDYLVQAREQAPQDPETLDCLLEVFLALEKYEDAEKAGRALMNAAPANVDDVIVARMALALIGLNRMDEASATLDGRPELDARNPLVKQARKALKRRSGPGLRSFWGDSVRIHRLLAAASTERLRTLADKAKALAGYGIGSRREASVVAQDSPPDSGDSRAAETIAGLPVKVDVELEYWIYTPRTEIPNWEEIKESLGRQPLNEEDRDGTVAFLESLIESGLLTIEYILRKDAEELFDYPEDVITQNSREFDESDWKTLRQSRMIVRVRLALGKFSGPKYLAFTVRFVEAVRSITAGLVQDAISHGLWGVEAWKKAAANAHGNLIGVHTQFEILDEGGTVWIHSHGMQKFGLPDLEMEDIPAELAFSGRRMMTLAAEALVGLREHGRQLQKTLAVPGTSWLMDIEARPADEEGHFPAGSLKLLPYALELDPTDPAALREVLAALAGISRSGRAPRANAQPAGQSPGEQPQPDARVVELRGKILDAHQKARKNLALFKKSFQKGRGSTDLVHAVKVGFPAHSGEYEWMWVSVNAWRGESMVGHLENSPVLRQDLERGSRVHISEGEVFDWVIAQGDNIVEGAYTEGIL